MGVGGSWARVDERIGRGRTVGKSLRPLVGAAPNERGPAQIGRSGETPLDRGDRGVTSTVKLGGSPFCIYYFHGDANKKKIPMRGKEYGTVAATAASGKMRLL